MEKNIEKTEKMEKTEKPAVPKRCQKENCRHKLGLVPFDCRCGKYFCAEHRFSEYHGCTYNYKEDHKKELLKFMSSPVVTRKIEVL